MGCGTSQVEKIPEGKRKPRVNGIELGSAERKILSEAISPTGEVPVRIQEEARSRPLPREAGGAFELPEGEFVDGLLGTTDDQTMRAMVNSLPEGQYFVDPDFPPSDQSLFFSPEGHEGEIEWKRPREVSSAPRVYVGDTTRKDVVQGKLSDCWLISSCAAVAKNQRCIERIVPSGQPLDGPEYRGFIVCHFWRFGDWVSVCIDDFLPTQGGKLIYAKSEDSDEFWIALLEKAYAKLHGCYQALEGGQSMDALVDLTGGIAERIDLADAPDAKQLFKHVSIATKNGAFVTTSHKGDWKDSFKADKCGLVEGHAYTVSGVAKVRHKVRGVVPLIRMRNPWANEIEWMGKWSDGDEMWDAVSLEMRKKLLRENKMDGEFWMSFDDFFKKFEEISLCTTGPDFDGDGVVDQVGTVLAIRGQWVSGLTAGGSRNDFTKFATNPQFLLTLQEPKEEEDEDSFLDESEMEASRGKCHVLIGLMQEHRFSVKGEAVHMHQIGFSVYKTHNPGERIPLRQFYRVYDEGTSGVYINYREVIARLELFPGHYVIIPATFEPDIPGDFIIRVYSPHEFELKSLE